MAKKRKEKECPWCGTRMRGRAWPDCPRGKVCAKRKAEHDELMVRIEGGTA